MTHELTNRIYEAHSLGATGNSDARIHGLISTIVGRKDLEALKLLFNASDANWKTMLCQPHFLPSFWCEQWYEGWEFIAPIFAKHPDNLGDVLDSVAANPQFSTVLVDAVLLTANSESQKGALLINHIITHAIKTNNPSLFDLCVAHLPHNSVDGSVVCNFNWVEHTNLACTLERVWAIEKAIVATKDDNVYYQMLENSAFNFPIAQIKKLFETVSKLYPNTHNIADKTLEKLTRMQGDRPRERWEMCVEILSATNAFTNPRYVWHMCNTLTLGLAPISNVSADQVQSFCVRHMYTPVFSLLLSDISSKHTPVREHILKHLANHHPQRFNQILTELVASPNWKRDSDVWLHRINDQVDDILAQSSVLGPMTQAWKSKRALQQELPEIVATHKKKM